MLLFYFSAVFEPALPLASLGYGRSGVPAGSSFEVVWTGGCNRQYLCFFFLNCRAGPYPPRSFGCTVCMALSHFTAEQVWFSNGVLRLFKVWLPPLHIEGRGLRTAGVSLLKTRPGLTSPLSWRSSLAILPV